MKLLRTPLGGAFLLELEPVEDERGSFARTFCRAEFARLGLDPLVAQASVSTNRRRGTLRGLHYQAPPHEEAKLVRCTRGRLFDVLVDLRPGSPTWARWYGVELAAGEPRQLYVPPGLAHGFLTLEDDTVVEYTISTPYVAELQRGIRYDDPALAIAWPGEVVVISERDRSLPSFEQR